MPTFIPAKWTHPTSSGCYSVYQITKLLSTDSFLREPTRLFRDAAALNLRRITWSQREPFCALIAIRRTAAIRASTFKIGPPTGGIGEEAEPQLRRWLRPGTAVPAAATNDPTQIAA
jgi:hypothetical protein